MDVLLLHQTSDFQLTLCIVENPKLAFKQIFLAQFTTQNHILTFKYFLNVFRTTESYKNRYSIDG